MLADARPLLAAAPVIPVLTIKDASVAVPLARALVAGGLPVIEVTLRTPQALSAIARSPARCRRRWSAPPYGRTSPVGITRWQRAGARFLVSPGTPRAAALAVGLSSCPVPVLPGCATVTRPWRWRPMASPPSSSSRPSPRAARLSSRASPARCRASSSARPAASMPRRRPPIWRLPMSARGRLLGGAGRCAGERRLRPHHPPCRGGAGAPALTLRRLRELSHLLSQSSCIPREGRTGGTNDRHRQILTSVLSGGTQQGGGGGLLGQIAGMAQGQRGGGRRRSPRPDRPGAAAGAGARPAPAGVPGQTGFPSRVSPRCRPLPVRPAAISSTS